MFLPKDREGTRSRVYVNYNYTVLPIPDLNLQPISFESYKFSFNFNFNALPTEVLGRTLEPALSFIFYVMRVIIRLIKETIEGQGHQLVGIRSVQLQKQKESLYQSRSINSFTHLYQKPNYGPTE